MRCRGLLGATGLTGSTLMDLVQAGAHKPTHAQAHITGIKGHKAIKKPGNLSATGRWEARL